MTDITIDELTAHMIDMPDVPDVPLPISEGSDAREWLEGAGLVARVPSIRSTDFDLCHSRPFNYYLARRLGIVYAFRTSVALSRGDWLHKCYQYSDEADVEPIIRKILDARIGELTAICKQFNVSDIKRQEAIADERQDALSALGWYRALADVTFPVSNASRMTIRQYIEGDNLLTIGREVAISVDHPDYPGTPLVVQLDRLCFNPTTRELWIVDFKTTSVSTKVRLLTCPIEFQTKHYLFVTNEAVKSGHLLKRFGLPADAKLAGMIHFGIRKPPLKLGSLDRPVFRVISTGARKKIRAWADISAGGWIVTSTSIVKDKDDTWREVDPSTRNIYDAPLSTLDEAIAAVHSITGKEPDLERLGEPSLDIYATRCSDYYHARGEYGSPDEIAERQADPPVNFSRVLSTCLVDPEWLARYHRELTAIHRLATIEACPANFAMTTHHLTYRRGEPDPYTPFYFQPVTVWPELIETGKFLIVDRDSGLDFGDSFQ